MKLKSPPTRDRLIETIGTLVGNESIQSFVTRALGSNAYNKYTNPTKPRDEQIAEILDGVETDGLERWLFTHLMARSVARDLVRDIVNACPGIIADLPETGPLVRQLLTPMQERIRNTDTGLLDAATVRKEISEDLSHMADDIFVHGSLSRLQVLVSDLLETYDSSATSLRATASQETAVRQLIEEVLDEVSLLPDRVVELPEEKKWVTEIKAMAADLDTALRDANHAKTGSVLASISRLLRKNFARVNRSLVIVTEELRTERIAALVGGTSEQPGFGIASIRPTLVGRALNSQIWQLVETDLWLLISLIGDDEESSSDFYKSWLSLKAKALWLASVTADADWRGEFERLAEAIEDLMAAQDKHDAGIKSKLNVMVGIIQDRFEPLSEQLKRDHAGLRPLLQALDLR